MTAKELEDLGLGDVIEHVGTREIAVVVGNYGSRATAVRVHDVTNPDEWRLRMKATHEKVNGEADELTKSDR